MTTRAECIEILCRLIARADRNELAEAQAAIIAHALAAPDLASRFEAMAALQAELGETCGGHAEPLQAAYYSVVDAMIDRTRDAVLGRGETGVSGS